MGHGSASASAGAFRWMGVHYPVGSYYCRWPNDGLYILSPLMPHALFPFFQWADASWIGTTVRNSRYWFPILELFHLFALTILLGTTLLLSLRLLGVLMPKQPMRELAHELAPWMRWSIVVVLISGLCMFFSGALRYYTNISFAIKMVLLFAALVFHFAYFRRIVQRDESSVSPAAVKLAGIGALVLWFSVGLAGRSIGFVG